MSEAESTPEVMDKSTADKADQVEDLESLRKRAAERDQYLDML